MTYAQVSSLAPGIPACGLRFRSPIPFRPRGAVGSWLLRSLRFLVVVCGWAVVARAQLEYPTIRNLTRESPAVVSSGGVVTYVVSLNPGTAPVDRVRFTFHAGASERMEAIAAADPASGRVSATIDPGWESGAYRLVAVSLRDTWGRTTTYDSEGRVMASAFPSQQTPYYAGPDTHAMDLGDLGFEVRNGSTRPRRTDLTDLVVLTSSPVAPGQSVRLRVSSLPGAVPLARILLTFTHATNASLTHLFTLETASPNGEFDVPVVGAMVNGRYRLTSVVTEDPEGRVVNYRGDGSATESLEGRARAIASTLSYTLDGASLTVSGASTTAPAAQLSAWERTSAAEMIPGGTVRFNFAAQGGAFPVEQVSIRIVDPFGGTRTLSSASASGSFAIPVTADWISGSYSVNLVTLTDAAGRRVNYLPVGGTAPVGGSIGVGRPAPAEQFTFTVRGGREVGPYFALQPRSATILPPGQAFVSLVAGAAGVGPVTYQWYQGEVGDTSQPLRSAQPAPNQLGTTITGPTTFWVRATTVGGSVDSQSARVAFRPADFGRLTNLSILTSLADGNDSFSVGCVAGGQGASGPKSVLVRAAGPSLAELGVADAAADPRLQLYRETTIVAENDNWGGAPALSAAMTAVGAFALTGPASRDAATLASFSAGVNHTVRISGTGAGRVIAELYDAGPGPVESATTPRLVNLSVLKQLGDGLTLGFSIAGASPMNVLVRAVGPGLAQAPFNVADHVRDPRLVIFRGPERIAVSDDWDWSNSTVLGSAFRTVGAFPLPNASKDAALLRTLSPGSYTVQIKAADPSAGLVLVEVYEVP